MADPLKTRINEDIKSALRAGDKRRLAALRLMSAAFKQREVDERIQLDDAAVVATLHKLAKQRRESIEQYGKAQRQDLVDQETFELEIIESYLPQQLSDADIDAAVAEAVAQTGAASMRDMGKVMGILKQRLAGAADMGKVSARVKAKLNG